MTDLIAHAGSHDLGSFLFHAISSIDHAGLLVLGGVMLALLAWRWRRTAAGAQAQAKVSEEK